MKLLTRFLHVVCKCFAFAYFIDSKNCCNIHYFHSQVIQSDLLNALPSYSCLAYILLDSNSYDFVLLTENNPFSSWFTHSADIDKWVVAR